MIEYMIPIIMIFIIIFSLGTSIYFLNRYLNFKKIKDLFISICNLIPFLIFILVIYLSYFGLPKNTNLISFYFWILLFILLYVLIFVLYYKFILLKNNLYLIFSLTSFLLSFFCLYKIYESILNLYMISNFFKLILLLIFIFILFAPFLYYIIKFKKYNLLIYVGLSILFLIIILILFLFIIKLINNDSNHCQSDSDCIFFNKECCPGFNLAYNKNYITTLQIEKFFECFLFNYGSCPNRVAPPFRIVREPYCNIDNKCSIKTNCDETCNIFKDSLISSNIMEQEYITSYFESSGCICENSNLVYN